MRIEIEVIPTHWWIERRDPADKSHTAEAMVRFKGEQDGNGKSYDHEEHCFGTPEECVAFVRRYFPEPQS